MHMEPMNPWTKMIYLNQSRISFITTGRRLGLSICDQQMTMNMLHFVVDETNVREVAKP